MIVSFLQKMGESVRPFFPVFTGIFFILLSAITLPFPYIGSIAPALGLVTIYYWAIYRPDILKPLAVFILGLLNDVVHFLPLGLSALVFVALYQLVLSQRRYFIKQSFFMLWTGFGLVSLISSFVMWCAVSLYEGMALPVLPVFMQFLMTFVIFPLPAWLLIKVQRTFLSQG